MSAHLTRREARAAEGTAVRPARRPRRPGSGRWVVLAVVPLALLGSGAFVYQASNAAFTGQTSAAASFGTGTVVIGNTPGTGTLSVSGVKPNDSGSRCFDVSYTGSLSSIVRLYLKTYTSVKASDGVTANPLGQYLQVKVEESSSACASASFSGGTYAGLASTASTRTDWTSGFQTWSNASITNPATRSFLISWQLPDCGGAVAWGAGTCPADQTTFDGAQGGSTGVTFVWEAHNV